MRAVKAAVAMDRGGRQHLADDWTLSTNSQETKFKPTGTYNMCMKQPS